jgi:hypothetical protein
LDEKRLLIVTLASIYSEAQLYTDLYYPLGFCKIMWRYETLRDQWRSQAATQVSSLAKASYVQSNEPKPQADKPTTINQWRESADSNK